MTEEVLHRMNTTLIRRQRLAPAESTPWHRDPYHRLTVIMRGDALAIEYRDGNPAVHLSLRPGQVDWDKPSDRVHRGVNVGHEPYEEIAFFLLDEPHAEPQPRADKDERHDGGFETWTAKGQEVVGVSSVVRDSDGRILLIKTETAGWELPGGRVEQGENLIDAVVREALEETGCEIDVGRFIGITVNTEVPRLTILTFLCRHIAGAPHPGDDSIDTGWFAPDTALRLITHPVEQLRLRDALSDGHGVVYRAYRRIRGDEPPHETFELLDLYRYS